MMWIETILELRTEMYRYLIENEEACKTEPYKNIERAEKHLADCFREVKAFKNRTPGDKK